MSLHLGTHDSAMPRALQVLELLDMVLRGLDRKTLAKAARVCRDWSNIALGHLWETLIDLLPLFKLLAPNGFELKENKLVCDLFSSLSRWFANVRSGFQRPPS
jgi:hypothetical protein